MIQELFVTYFGRPAFPDEAAYWTGQIEEFIVHGDTESAHFIFGESMPEFHARLAGQSNSQIVASAYARLFNRDPDAAGQAFWKEQLDKHTITAGGLMRVLAEGAQGADKLAYENKVSAAQAFAEAAAEAFEHDEQIDAGAAIDFVAAVATSASLDAAIAALPEVMADIAALPENLHFTGTVSIEGELAVGATVTATHNLQDGDGLGAIVYLWYSGYRLVQSSTSATLEITEEFAGKSLWVTAAFADLRGEVGTAGTQPTNPVRMSPAAKAVEQVYVEYLGRPADAEALERWTAIVEAQQGTGIQSLRTAVLASTEFARLYSGKTAEQKVEQVFQTLFGRPPEPEGLAYWAGTLKDGTMDIGSVIREVAKGAQGEDRAVLDNKVWAAEAFSGSLDDNYLKMIYAGYDAYALGRGFIAGVTDLASRDAALAEAAEAVYGLTELAPNHWPQFSYQIVGEVAVGNTLELKFIDPIEDEDGVGPLSYQWKANGVAIPGATSSKYVVQAAYAGATITVSFSYVDERGFEESFDSYPLQAIQTHAGSAGADTLAGGIGDDIYVINHAGDQIVEKAHEGIDTALVSLANGGTFVLPANVEKGTAASGTAPVNITGNATSNVLTGNDGANTLIGGEGNDFLDGRGGKDTLVGGVGDDYYTVDNVADVITELADQGQDRVTATVNSYTLGANVEGLYFGGKGNFTGTGNELDNFLVGGTGDDKLSGAAGGDTMHGLAGSDTLDGGSGADRLHGGDGSDKLFGGEGDDEMEGGAGEDSLDGGAGADIMNGGDGNDKLSGGDDNDWLWGSAGADSLDGGNGADQLVGGDGNDNVLGGAGADKLWGDAGDDVLDGGADGDQMVGGDGNDKLNGGDGDDQIWTGAGNDTVSGGEGADVIRFDSGNDLIDGGAGNDVVIMNGTLGEYTRSRPNGTDTVLVHKVSGATITLRNVERVVFIDADLTLAELHDNIATPFDDELTGSDEADLLDGGLGNDTMSGGLGHDRYVVSGPGDTIIEDADAGTDEVRVAYTVKGTFTLADNVERAIVTSAASIAVNLEGNELNNNLVGNGATNVINGGAGNDFIDGGAGKDTLSGGTGDDFFVVDNAGDVVRESKDEGRDTVITTLASITLAAEVENLLYDGKGAFAGTGNGGDNLIAGAGGSDKLSGLAGDDTLFGEGGNDTLLGGDGDDYLDGGSGENVLDGGAGQDTAYIEGSLDEYVRVRISATDTVLTNAERGVRITLRNIESVTNGTDTWSIDQVNENLASIGNDTLVGTDDDDEIDGGLGSDTMEGGEGDDRYFLDVVSDSVIEEEGAGIDTVVLGFKGAANYVLGEHVENAIVNASGAINVTGNALDNELKGGAGANILNAGAGDDLLDGGAGKDTMIGGAGDDVYVADITADLVTETQDGGTDLVKTSAVSYKLSDFVENLTYTGNKGFTGTGNAGNNVILGNVGADKLIGGAGEDYLYGGDGNDSLDGGLDDDRLLGGAGNDTLLGGAGKDELYAGTGVDIVDGGADQDTLYLEGKLADYTRSRPNATDLVLANKKTGEQVTLRNVENIVFMDAEKTIEQLLADRGTATNDVLNGTDGDDVLDGGGGVDTMTGGRGDDTYVVSIAADIVKEEVDEGLDLVEVAFTANGSYVLAANVENASVTAAATLAVNLTGNALANHLTGNGGANTLLGAGGDDILSGGLGNDILNGGAGADEVLTGAGKDIVVLDSAEGYDTVGDFTTLQDKLRISQSAFKIGDGDAVVEGGLVRTSAGGFSDKAELVIFSTNIAGDITEAAAASTIGSATADYIAGAKVLFVVDNGVDSAVYLFTSSGKDKEVSASELTLIAELVGTPATALADYAFAS
ncbi:hypothetical protein B0920_06510 [Massilia sp. KIM]|nr:hypothetical protein B0920_06510 [Massilia sp. KIM]